MSSRLSRILLSTLCLAAATIPSIALAGAISIPAGNISGVSMSTVTGSDSLTQAQNFGMDMLQTFKVVLSGLAVVFMVYLGATIVMSMGQDAEIKKAKQQLIHTFIAFLFINIPGQLYNLFGDKQNTSIDTSSNTTYVQSANINDGNLFVNLFNWNLTIEGGVIPFLQVLLVGIAVFLFTFAAIQLMSARGTEDEKKHAKGSIFYGVMALIFTTLIGPLVRIVYSDDVVGGQRVFSQLANLALLFAAPVVVFFFILAAFYYLTAFGSPEKAKKAQSIVVNTCIATLILLAIYALLLDMNSLTFSTGS